MSKFIYLLGLILALSACTSATQPSEFEVSPAEGPPDEFAVPAEIDSAYVATVLAKLEEVRTELLANNLQQKPFTDTQQRQLDAIFSEGAREFQTYEFRDRGVTFEGFATDDPAPMRQRIVRLVTVEPDCIWLKAIHSQRHNRIDKKHPEPIFDIVLKKTEHDMTINPTPWTMAQFTPESLDMVREETACGR